MSPGDVVVLKTCQGPRMVIDRVNQSGEAMCCWFVARCGPDGSIEYGDLRKEWIGTAALKVVVRNDQ